MASPTVQLKVYVPAATRDALRRQAVREGRSMSSLVTEIITDACTDTMEEDNGDRGHGTAAAAAEDAS